MDADAFEDLWNAVHADLAPSGAVEAQGRYAEAEPVDSGVTLLEMFKAI